MSAATLRRLIVIGLIALWEILPRAGLIPTLFLPPLSSTLAAGWSDAGEYGHALAVTLYEVAISMVFACGGGILAGAIVGSLPRANARSLEQFEGWLREIEAAREARLASDPSARVGPLAVNLLTRLPPEELDHEIAVCRSHGVDLFISAAGMVDVARLVDLAEDAARSNPGGD